MSQKPTRFVDEFQEYNVFSVEHDVHIGDSDSLALLDCPGCHTRHDKNSLSNITQCGACFRRWHKGCWKYDSETCDECGEESSTDQTDESDKTSVYEEDSNDDTDNSSDDDFSDEVSDDEDEERDQ